MATLADWQINDLANEQGLITPYSIEQLNPASYDVTLGSKILVETRLEGRVPIDISKKGFMMAPGAFVLAHTVEVIKLPSHIESTFQLKSSRGREGYEHAMAGYIDPGFEGQITLELSNLNQYTYLPLKPGMRIGQLRFMLMADVPDKPYSKTGRYHKDMGVVESKG